MSTIRATAADFWRLAEQGKQRGIRILRHPLTNEHYATSATDPTILYRVTGFSCTCRVYFTWQRCQHHALLLAELGWLPDLEDPDPAPVPVAQPTPADGVCPTCLGSGTDWVISLQGEDVTIPCPSCTGSPEPAIPSQGTSPDPAPAESAPATPAPRSISRQRAPWEVDEAA